MKAVVYERTSGDEDEGQDVDAQTGQTIARAEAAGFEVVAPFGEDDVPGDAPWEKRAELREALELARSRGAVLVVREVSRLSRFPPHVGRGLIETVRDLEVLGRSHWSRREGRWASDEDSAELMRLIDLWDSWKEKRKTKERTQLAMDDLKDGRRKTESGKPHHRPPVEYEPAHLEAARAVYARGGRGAMTNAWREMLRLRGYDDAKDPRTKKARYISKAKVGELLGVYSVRKGDASQRGEAPSGTGSIAQGPLPDTTNSDARKSPDETGVDGRGER